jgi:hypothetical protein
MIDELSRKLSPAYAILRKVGEGAVARQLGLLLDELQAEQITPGAALDRGVEAILALPEAERAPAARCWRTFVARARPDRKSASACVEVFPVCLACVETLVRPAFFDGLPPLGPAAHAIGADLFTSLAGALNHSGPGNAALVLRFAAAYAETSPEIARAAVRIAVTCAQARREDLLETLMAAFPFAQVFDTRENERLLPALAPLPATALPLLTAILRDNVSSTVDVAKRLPALLAKQSNPGAYLDAFHQIHAVVGPRAIGFCLSHLPALDHARTAALARDTAAQAGALAAENAIQRNGQ